MHNYVPPFRHLKGYGQVTDKQIPRQLFIAILARFGHVLSFNLRMYEKVCCMFEIVMADVK